MQKLKMHPVEKAYHRMRKTAEGNPSSAVFSLDLDAFFEWTATEFYDHRYGLLVKIVFQQTKDVGCFVHLCMFHAVVCSECVTSWYLVAGSTFLKKSYKLTPAHQQTCNLKIVEVQKEEGPKGDEDKAGEDKEGAVEVNSPMKPITETEQKQTRKRKVSPFFLSFKLLICLLYFFNRTSPWADVLPGQCSS